MDRLGALSKYDRRNDFPIVLHFAVQALPELCLSDHGLSKLSAGLAEIRHHEAILRTRDSSSVFELAEIAPEPTGHGLPLNKCEAYNRVYDQPYEAR